jgi:hypothetical protein
MGCLSEHLQRGTLGLWAARLPETDAQRVLLEQVFDATRTNREAYRNACLLLSGGICHELGGCWPRIVHPASGLWVRLKI